MRKEVEIRIVEPKTLDQKRAYYIRRLAEIDDQMRQTKANLAAVSNSTVARRQILSMKIYVRQMHQRIEAHQNARIAIVNKLTVINKAIKERNRFLSGRKQFEI